jgi:ribosome-associated heat shock protein Hsp15
MTGAAPIRLDRLLVNIRLVKSRSLAQALIAEGRVRIDGRRVDKPSEPVRPGAVLSLALHGKVRILRVLACPDRRGPAPEARSCYEEIAEAAAS